MSKGCQNFKWDTFNLGFVCGMEGSYLIAMSSEQ